MFSLLLWPIKLVLWLMVTLVAIAMLPFALAIGAIALIALAPFAAALLPVVIVLACVALLLSMPWLLLLGLAAIVYQGFRMARGTSGLNPTT